MKIKKYNLSVVPGEICLTWVCPFTTDFEEHYDSGSSPLHKETEHRFLKRFFENTIDHQKIQNY